MNVESDADFETLREALAAALARSLSGEAVDKSSGTVLLRLHTDLVTREEVVRTVVELAQTMT